MKPGPVLDDEGADFRVHAPDADALWLCLFDDGDREERLAMARDVDGLWHVRIEGLGAGTRYGLRADGAHDPASGLWFDPAKLLLDPWATAIDRPFVYDSRLAASRREGIDTASLMPKGVLVRDPPALAARPPSFRAGGLIYELPVRAFTMRHPDVPPPVRGTIAALAEPVVIDHLRALRVDAVQLMPINAWIDERHLPPLGLSNGWGYNPVSWFALDPRLAPGGWAEFRGTVAALHEAGIAVLIDMVFNHDGESDMLGPTLSLRGLDGRTYFRREPDGRLINDTGTGNSIDCNAPVVRCMIRHALRRFVEQAGVDGFRFDLAPALGRLPHGFDPQAPLLRELREDPVLADRVMIAEPWDIGPGGYQLGQFGPDWLEWNDRYRDDVRRFWRGDGGMLGVVATRLAGSADIFGQGEATRTVNFLAAHDGFALADMVAYADRHNEANGEQNRDGHSENFSWNNGAEGPSDHPAVNEARRRDVKALLATLFCSRGTIMLTAGDEFGRTQHGNNNAYAQDNDVTWLDWNGRDREVEAHAMAWSSLRARCADLRATGLMSNDDVEWLDEAGMPMTVAQWEDPARRCLTFRFSASGVAICVNGLSEQRIFRLPEGEYSIGPRSLLLVDRESAMVSPAGFEPATY
ncbi:MAG: glycogen debranching protein GlgX [Sphingobium sp.]